MWSRCQPPGPLPLICGMPAGSGLCGGVGLRWGLAPLPWLGVLMADMGGARYWGLSGPAPMGGESVQAEAALELDETDRTMADDSRCGSDANLVGGVMAPDPLSDPSLLLSVRPSASSRETSESISEAWTRATSSTWICPGAAGAGAGAGRGARGRGGGGDPAPGHEG